MHLSWFFTNLPFAFLTALAWALLAFATSFVVKRHAIIDVFWGSGFLVVYLESLLVSHLKSVNESDSMHLSNHAVNHWIHLGLLIAVALWSLRLSIYLALRQRGTAEDTRYVAILANTKGSNDSVKALKIIYFTQGTLLFLVSIPLQFVAFANHVTLPALTFVGLSLALVGFGFEAIGDDQLRRFIANPDNHGTTMNRGLWKYTRHPNYFGEAVLWTGYFLVACSVPWGWATIGSPLLMIYLVANLSGKPMLERKLKKTRAGYEEYIATTSSFFPRPPKRTK